MKEQEMRRKKTTHHTETTPFQSPFILTKICKKNIKKRRTYHLFITHNVKTIRKQE